MPDNLHDFEPIVIHTGQYDIKANPTPEVVQPAADDTAPAPEGKAVAAIISDLHLCDKAPKARAKEPNWYQAMWRMLLGVRKVVEREKIPLLIAGDIFDRPKPEPRVISLAMEALRGMEVWAVVGQHDLMHHNYEDLKVTGFHTLKVAGIIKELKPNVIWRFHNKLAVQGFGWNVPLSSPQFIPMDMAPDAAMVAICHKYIHKEGCSYPGAPEEALVERVAQQLSGFTHAFFGDNHKQFELFSEVKGVPDVLNCGTFFRRHADDIEIPRMLVLKDDGDIDPYEMTDEDEVFEENENSALKDVQAMQELVGLLRTAEGAACSKDDFIKSVKHAIVSGKPGTTRGQKILLEALSD